MKKLPKEASSFIYDEEGTNHVSEQIMNAYNSGVVDQTDGQFDMAKFAESDVVE